MTFSIKTVYFKMFIHLIIAFTFLSEILKPTLPVIVYNFFNNNKNTIFGLYYLYLTYEVYNKIEFVE